MMEMLCSYTVAGKNKHDDVPDGMAMLKKLKIRVKNHKNLSHLTIKKYDYNVLEKIRKSPKTRINKGVSRLFALVAGTGCGCPVDTFAKQKHRPRRQPRPPTCFARLCHLPSCGARTHAHLERGVLFDRCANNALLHRPLDACGVVAPGTRRSQVQTLIHNKKRTPTKR